MFLRILKKDIKRKKTMNIILLMFVILSVMFASSSVNNMVTVSRGIDYYFEKAGMTDCYIFVQEPDETNTLSKVLDKEKSVISYKKEPVLMLTSDDLFQNGKKMSDFIGAAFIISVDEAKLNYFDIKNNIIDNVERGKVYISGDLPYQANLEIGDSFEIKLGETELELEYAGKFKDASASGIKLLVNNDDYEKLLKEKKYPTLHTSSIQMTSTLYKKQLWISAQFLPKN